MQIGCLRHSHSLNVNSEGSYTEAVSALFTSTRTVVLVTMTSDIGSNEDGGDILVQVVWAIKIFEKALKLMFFHEFGKKKIN